MIRQGEKRLPERSETMRILKAAFSVLLTLFVCAAIRAGETPRPAAPLTFTAIDGRQVSLAELRGKVVLVMFFSTTCPHCQRAAQTLDPIYQEFKAKGFEIFGLAMNDGAETMLKNFARKYNATYPMTTTTRAEFGRFTGLSVMARFYYPYLLLIDRSGQVREERQGGERMYFSNLDRNMRRTLAKLLAEKPAS